MRGFSPRSSQSCFSAVLDRRGAPGIDVVERASGRVENPGVEQRRVRLDVVEEEAREAGELVEPRDLLLDDRRCSADEIVRPVDALLAEVLHQARRVRVGGERAQVHAVHPVELRVVERRRARPHALEREPRDQLVRRHDRRLAVRGPAEEREEVHQCLGDVARCCGTRRRTRPRGASRASCRLRRRRSGRGRRRAAPLRARAARSPASACWRRGRRRG